MLVDGGKTKFTTCTVAQIARSLIAILNHPEETANKMVFTESFTTDQVEVLTALEKATGEKWNIVNAQADDIRSEGFKAMSEGDVMGGGDMWVGELYWSHTRTRATCRETKFSSEADVDL